MKRKEFFIGIIAASVLTAVLTAFGVSNLNNGNSRTEYRTVEFMSGGAGTHFTSYDRDNYPDLTYAAENAVQAVVNIIKTEEIQMRSRSGYDPFFELFFGPQGGGYYDRDSEGSTRERQSGGSGVIISADGYIVTNNHVIENASKLTVTLHDNKTYEGRIIGRDAATDIALVKIDAEDLPTVAFGDSDALRLGEWVLAIGSPYDLRSTVTAGIVSAKARSLRVIPSTYSIESFIQTDAAVNPGNSGGALVNVKGELVGINTVIKSPTGSFAGYSFAVPTSIVKKVVVDLKEYGTVQRALLGVSYRVVDDSVIEEYGDKYKIRETGGLYVDEVVEDSAADAAGLKKGDVITEIDGTVLDHSSALQEYIATKRPGDKVNLSVKREGKVKQMEVVLRNMAGKTEVVTTDYVTAEESLGGTFRDITDAAKKEFKIEGGVYVLSVSDSGLLADNGIRKGSIITHINDRTVRTVRDLSRITGEITSIEVINPQGRSVRHMIHYREKR